jgi:hypothetical protein
MKRLFEIGILALALTAGVGCATHRYGYYGPPPQAVIVVHAQPARVWVPGYYRWSGNRYRWVEGRWMTPPRPGMVWVPGYRARRGNGYVWIEGYWR